MRVVEWAGGEEEWDAFVGSVPGSTVMHLYGWKRVLERAYKHRTHFLAALDGETVAGVLPLALVRGPLLRPSLVSMPYMDYGGPCVRPGSTAGTAEQSLVEEALRLAQDHRAFLTLRNVKELDGGLPSSLDKVTVVLDLGASEDALWKRLPSERRNRIRKGQKNGLTAHFGGAELLADFYSVFAANMRDLGSPTHSRGFFREVARALGDRARVVVVRSEKTPVGAGLMLLHGGMISMPWVSSLREHFSKCPNQVLYWEVMRWGIGQGLRVMDFGRSSRGSGTFEAKRQWAGEPVQLYWQYHPADAEPPGEDVKRFSWAAWVWQRLPIPVANAVGPWVRRGLPN